MESGSHHRQNGGPSDRAARLNPQAPSMGDYFTFEAGQFAGRTIRVELVELQKAESGRKYAKVDRRPLDPPPAVLLRLFEAADGTPHNQWEREILHEDVLNVGLICTVDLFPVPEELYGVSSPGLAHPSPQSPYPTLPYPDGIGPSGGGYEHAQRPVSPLTYFPLHPYMNVGVSGGAGLAVGSSTAPQFQIPRRPPMLGYVTHEERPHDTVHRIGSHLITESSKLTPALVGERFAEPTLVDYQGRKALVFVFGDLAVRREGIFILRYRAFDIFSSVAGSPHAPILAEMYGGPFKVYSTREFPGLEPSTDLTRTLSKYGVRVTLRDAERKSKKRPKDAEYE
ncbi:hypothetical protein BDN70DRAFT_908467 [Pholiota conissans]|uniref:Velvet domain-containing protein n=1 Tax=Pholiota conissans TaxID=109636 RepID=A0A9P5YS71_9AGAR|nr:hypothetical protein BDN70DRAFT_908467 [Pholiota conissans]